MLLQTTLGSIAGALVVEKGHFLAECLQNLSGFSFRPETALRCTYLDGQAVMRQDYPHVGLLRS